MRTKWLSEGVNVKAQETAKAVCSVIFKQYEDGVKRLLPQVSHYAHGAETLSVATPLEPEL